MRKVFLGFIAFLPLAGCNGEKVTLVAMGTLEGERIELVADSSEPIIAVHVTEGDSVEPGRVLTEQDPSRVLTRLNRAEANLSSARARLEKAEAGPRAQEIQRARALVAAAMSNAGTVKFELDRAASMVEQEFASQNTVDILKGRYDEALAQHDAARAALEEMLEGTRSEEIDAARSNLAAARATVEEIRISFNRTRLLAPLAATVEAVAFELGERPRLGQVIVILLSHDAPYARVHVPEILRTRLRPGANARIHIDGHATAFTGTLRWIAREASFTPYFALTQRDRGHLSYLAEVELTDDAARELPVGIPVQVTFPDVSQ